jgi:hypothetical protein
MVCLIPIWLCLFLLLLGTGLWVSALLPKLGGSSLRAPLGTFQLFWFGYAFTIAFLELYSLAFAIRWPAVALLALGAAFGFWQGRRAIAARLRAWRARPRLSAALCLISVGMVILVAARAAQRPGWYDTELYHLQVVQWARTFPAVPGIANLHYRLAYNNSIHLFAALTDCFYKNRACHLALGLLACVTAIQLIACVLRPAHQRSRQQAGYALLTLPFVLARIASNEIASLSSDLPLNLLAIVVVLELLAPRRTKLCSRAEPRASAARRVDPSLALALALAAAATTTKLGGLGLLVVAAVATLLSLRARNFPKPLWLGLGALPTAILTGYFARQVVLSGWLFFPAPIGNLHLAWTLPEPEASDQFRWIQSWARIPGREPADVLDRGLWRWFDPWFEGFSGSNEALLLALALVVAVVRLAQPRSRQLPWHAAALSAAALSLLLWFRGAPDLRFGAGFFWVMLAVIAGPVLARMLSEPMGRWIGLGLCLALASWSGGLSARMPHSRFRVKLPAADRGNVKRVELSPGLEVNVPAQDGSDRCANAFLPCTPYPAHQRLRNPKDLSAGFLY